MVFNPSAGDVGVYVVEGDDVVGCEEAVEEEADHAADGVFGEEVEGVVDPEEVFGCARRRVFRVSIVYFTIEIGDWSGKEGVRGDGGRGDGVG